MINELVKEMVEAGVHFGHQTKKWNPKMKPFLMKDKGGIFIINLEETVRCLDKASEFLSGLASRKKNILFVGCKQQAQTAVQEAAEATGQFYVNHRWLGGTLTNLATIRQSVERLRYLEGIEKAPEFKSMSKKEPAALHREKANLLRTPKESIAVAEARRLNIPIIGIIDTNGDPSIIDYPVPANDDSIRSVRTILQNLVDAIVAAKA